jgi:hypothetical protein
MKRKHLNKEERERAAALNASITQIMTLHDDCLYGLRNHYDESAVLLKYLELKTEFAYNDDCFYFYEIFIFRLKKLTEDMHFCTMGAAKMETKLHRFCMHYNRHLKHLECAAGVRERSAVFLEMESETDAMLSEVIRLCEAVEVTKIDFQHLKKEATVIEGN